MAQSPRKLRVALSRQALSSLDHIWDWNAKNYNVERANRYVKFLLTETEKLESTYPAGRIVPTRPELQYLLVKRRRRQGHGHIAVYQAMADTVYVLDFFHTAQDWPRKLAK